MSGDRQPPEETTPSEADIGPSLRRAREARGLEREEVAQQLHLSVNQIADLEEERFENFPAPIFVSGYLRKYAMLLGLPADPLLAAYENRGMAPPPLHAELVSVPSRRGPVRMEYWAGALVGAGILALLLTWLLSGDEAVPPPPVLPSPSAAVPDSEAGTTGTPSPPPLSPAVAEPSIPASPAVSPAGPPTPSAAPPPAAGGVGRLVLRFTADSWVEIRDADGRRLMFDLGRAGQSRTLEGRPPFSVLLGYAPGVEIEYNEMPYDFRRHVRNRVARFRLD